MLKKILPKSIRGKIILCTSAITISIAAITVTVCFLVFQSFLRRNQIQAAEYNLQVISNNVTADMDTILYFNRWCCSNLEINRFLESFRDQTRMPSISSPNSGLRTIALSTYERLKEEYYNTHSADYITRVIISPGNRRNYLQISDTAAATTSAVADMLYECDFFNPLISAKDYEWYGFLPDPLASAPRQLILPVIRPIYTQFNSEIVGWTYLSISDRIILDCLDSLPLEADSSLYITLGERSYLLKDGAFLESPLRYEVISDISSQAFNPDTAAFYARLPDQRRRAIITAPLGNDGWSISYVLSEATYHAQRQVYMIIIGGIVLVIGLMGVSLYAILDRIIRRPVQKLQNRITCIAEGDFSPDPSIEGADEFGTIGTGINQMSSKVVTLMDKKVKDEKQKKDLEYQILQSQINPHFLYNTLNSIKWMATIQNATGIAEMTTALARLMKCVSKGTSARVSLKEELALVNDYFLIQQYRYGGSISLEYDITDEQLYRCQIHRFTLQPIIENALFHGIEPKGCAGKILVRAEESTLEDETPILKVSVTDNGIGMSAETIRQVLHGESAPRADFFRQVGINNVHKRIQYDFGESYGITIESRPGEYTTMTITLPYLLIQGGTDI